MGPRSRPSPHCSGHVACKWANGRDFVAALGSKEDVCKATRSSSRAIRVGMLAVKTAARKEGRAAVAKGNSRAANVVLTKVKAPGKPVKAADRKVEPVVDSKAVREAGTKVRVLAKGVKGEAAPVRVARADSRAGRAAAAKVQNPARVVRGVAKREADRSGRRRVSLA